MTFQPIPPEFTIYEENLIIFFIIVSTSILYLLYFVQFLMRYLQVLNY
jgi:hypothetical protein